MSEIWQFPSVVESSYNVSVSSWLTKVDLIMGYAKGSWDANFLNNMQEFKTLKDTEW